MPYAGEEATLLWEGAGVRYHSKSICYAVANAVPELKAAATGILTDPDLAAVGRFIEKDSTQQKENDKWDS